VQHVKTVPAYHVEEIEETLKQYLALDEPSVLIAQEECALLPSARKRWVPLEWWASSATAVRCASASAARPS